MGGLGDKNAPEIRFFFSLINFSQCFKGNFLHLRMASQHLCFFFVFLLKPFTNLKTVLFLLEVMLNKNKKKIHKYFCKEIRKETNKNNLV